MLPVKGNKAGTEALQETTGTFGIVWSQKVGRENVQWGGSQTTRNYKLKLRKKKDISNEMAPAAACPPCQKQPLSGQAAQPQNR